MIGKSQKVYAVRTGVSANAVENELLNWAKYQVLAKDAKEAIENAEKLFTSTGEYAYAVEFVTELS